MILVFPPPQGLSAWITDCSLQPPLLQESRSGKEPLAPPSQAPGLTSFKLSCRHHTPSVTVSLQLFSLGSILFKDSSSPLPVKTFPFILIVLKDVSEKGLLLACYLISSSFKMSPFLSPSRQPWLSIKFTGTPSDIFSYM